MYKDIIERAIEQFAASIARIIQMRQERQDEQVQQYINSELLKLLGMDINNIISMPEKIIREVLSKKYADTWEHQIYIADLLKEHGHLKLDQACIMEANKLFHLALGILRDVAEVKAPGENKKIASRIKAIEKILS